jgi:hypothetical protein
MDSENGPKSEAALRGRFIQFLVEKKHYPPQSILAEYVLGGLGLSSAFRPDLIVADIRSSVPLAIIEFRVGPANPAKEARLLQVARGLVQLTCAVPSYVVSDRAEDPGFNVSLLTTSVAIAGNLPTSKAMELNDIPSYEQLTTASLARNLEVQYRDRKHTLDLFSAICYILAVVVAGLFVWSVFRPLPISKTQFGLLAVSLAMFVLPNAAKLKMLGLEFERRMSLEEEHPTQVKTIE